VTDSTNRSNDPSKDSFQGSHELTNERTNEEGRDDSDQAAVSNAGEDEFTKLADVIEAGFLPTGDRFPISRTGERTPIPWHIRAAVYYRDDARCQMCGTSRPRPWHLDHIIPWSAGGPDTTENLRLLCEPCNMRRSNFDLRDVFAKRPVTWWCHRCYLPHHAWRYDELGAYHIRTYWRDPRDDSDPDPQHFRCRVEAIYEQQIAQGEVPTWHERAPIEHLTAIAFCAHCNLPGLTDVTL